MDEIKKLLEQGQLAEANAQLLAILRDPVVVENVMTTITADHDFWKEVLSLHEFRIIADDEDPEDVNAPRYVNVGPVSFFLKHIDTIFDVIRYSIHGGAHYKCEQMWKKCNVPMNLFNEHYLAWLEDIYGQRFVQATAPMWHRGMPITAEYYFEHHQIEMTDIRRQVVNMLTDEHPVENHVFDTIRQWLYTADPLKQITFDTYMMTWAQAVKNAEFKQLLDDAFV